MSLTGTRGQKVGLVQPLQKLVMTWGVLLLAPLAAEAELKAEADLLQACPALSATPQPPYWLCSVGSRFRIMRENDLRPRIALTDLPDDPHLVAVGPVAGLQGEITLYQGRAFLATIEDDAQRVRETRETSAIFLAFGSARHWQEMTIDAPLSGFDALETEIERLALLAGIDPELPFPFRIEGTASELDYHVIFKSDDEPHSHAAHQRAKVPFSAPHRRIRVAGVWSGSDGHGHYTHPGQRSHLHVIVGDAEGMGHIDAMTLTAGATLFLPRP